MMSGIPFPIQSYTRVQEGHGSSVISHNAVPLVAQSVPAQAVLQQAQAHAQADLQGQQQQQQFQRLKVEDALSYLDQVKLQFGNKPHVYNDFLDIMKEFKSQVIDTPGVINRVSQLFHGHPDLIVGFNTFLPPGYKIEVKAETIDVHRPGQAIMSLPVNNPPKTQNSNDVMGNMREPMGARPMYPGGPINHPSSLPAHPISPEPPVQPVSQPVEFNHAINYVNKIKNRFQDKPEVYKSFLEILHTYQKDQRTVKDCVGGTDSPVKLTEVQVFSKVSALFDGQKDLLEEFGQFLPDANGSSLFGGISGLSSADSALGGMRNDHSSTVKKSAITKNKNTVPLRRQPISVGPPPKRPRLPGNLNMADVHKVAELNDFAFFDKVRKALRNQHTYDNFLRCLALFNDEVVTREELYDMVKPFFLRFPELFRRLKSFFAPPDTGMIDPIPQMAISKEKMSADRAMDIDIASCKRHGASYRSLPDNIELPKCSGRTTLDREVLNDTYVSFPSWSEDSSFVTSRKTPFEENIYRCEDERFELDIVIETNLSTVRTLESIQKKMDRMSPEEGTRYRLDNNLGGSSEIIHRKAIQRLYGDKAAEIIDGLKKNPLVAVPLVLRRLKAKAEEWREAQVGFNKIWREQNEKFYLKSLDHQGLTFKQADLKAIRSKALLNDIEIIYEERDQAQEGSGASKAGLPHLTFVYKDKSILDSVCDIVMHHMKRQTSIHSEDKQKIKKLLLHHLPDLFHVPRGDLSGDEMDEDDHDSPKSEEKPASIRKREMSQEKEEQQQRAEEKKEEKARSEKSESEKTDSKPSSSAEDEEEDMDTGADDNYSLIYCNNTWYILLRLHELLASRLHKIACYSRALADEEMKGRGERRQSTAVALRLKRPTEIEPQECYNYFFDLVKQLLDGNTEPSAYEDQLREMFGINAYIAFTMDKIVQNIVKQLQQLVSDETCQKVVDLWLAERKVGGAGGSQTTAHQRAHLETLYQRKAEVLLADENCFKVILYKNETKLTIELLDTETSAEDVTEGENWSEYITNYVQDKEEEGTSTTPKDVRSYLKRNARVRKHGLAKFKSSSCSSESETGVDEAVDLDRKQALMAMLSDFSIWDTSECKFIMNNYNIVYVRNKGSSLYKRLSISKARKTHKAVSRRMHSRFTTWLNERLKVGGPVSDRCTTWMAEGIPPLVDGVKTTKVTVSCLESKPYHYINRYKTKYQEPPMPSAPQ